MSAALSSGAHTWLRYNRSIALALPAPSEEWTLADVNYSQATLRTLSEKGHIQRTGTVDSGGAHVWRTDSATYAYVEKHLERNYETPCGNSGVRCIDAGETYTCTADDCDCRFDRETAEQVMR